MTPSQAARDRYDRRTYNTAIERACLKAGVPRWHPNQLRHTAATAIRARLGLDAAQTVLGHAKADVTQVYAERDLTKTQEVMSKMG